MVKTFCDHCEKEITGYAIVVEYFDGWEATVKKQLCSWKCVIKAAQKHDKDNLRP